MGLEVRRMGTRGKAKGCIVIGPRGVVLRPKGTSGEGDTFSEAGSAPEVRITSAIGAQSTSGNGGPLAPLHLDK